MPASSSTSPAQGALPNLKNLVTKDMVKTIGTGAYAAPYTPWGRVVELLNEHAPGWQPEAVFADDGSILHKAPNGGYLLIRFRNLHTNAVTPAYPQAVQDNRNKAIPVDKIDARDITDTHRRGIALAAAAIFNLGIELWTKDEVLSSDGYSRAFEDTEGTNPPRVQPVAAAPAAAAPAVTKEQFLEAAIEKGLTTHSAEDLLSKLNGNFAGGIKRLKEKDQAWVESYNKTTDPKNNAEQF